MNRYQVIRGLRDVQGISGASDQTSYLVIDLDDNGNKYVIADCGDGQGRADKVAEALNDFDGGPL